MSDAGAAIFNDKIVATELDISGDMDIDGITNLDVVDIDGNVQLDGTLTVGVDNTGYDVKLFGATSGAYLLWDESADKLLTAGDTVIDIVKDKLLIGSTAVTTTAAELNTLDGVTSTAAELNLLDGSSADTVVNSKAVIYGSSGEVAGTLSTAAQTSVTSLGTLTALTVDNVAINGSTIGHTSDTDLMTVASGALSVLGTVRIGDGGTDDMILKGAVAAAVAPGGSANAAIITTAGISSSAYQVGIEVPSNDSNDGFYVATDSDQDGTVDLIAMKIKANGYMGILNTAPTTALDVTGTVTSDAFAGPLTGNVTGNVSGTAATVTTAAQSNITSLGTLTALTVEGLLNCSNDSGAPRVRQQVASDRGYLYLYSENDYAIGRWYADANGSLIRLYETEAEQTRVQMGIDENDDGYVKVWSAANSNTIDISGDGSASFSGAVSKGSGSFNIEHPLESKKETHRLVHSFIEGPQADLIYRGKVDLIGGDATVNIDIESGMTEGTFVALCRDVQSFTTNESGWTAVRSSVSGNILTIEAQDAKCTDSISWMVVGERQDDHMIDTGWTDEIGKVIVEPLIPEPEEEEEDDE